MKRKIACVLSAVLMTVMLGACGTDPTTVDYNGYSYSDLSSAIIAQAYYTGALDDYSKSQFLNTESIVSEEEMSRAMQYGLITEQTAKDAQKWGELVAEFGDEITITDSKGNKTEFLVAGFDAFNFKTDSFVVTKSGETLTTDIIITFGDRDVDYQLVYDYFTMELTGVTIEPVYSLSEKMAKAGLNTVISLCIVFAVLILISLIICCFNIFPYIEKKKKEKAAKLEVLNTTETTSAEEAVVANVTEAATDDAELIAVIAAAIAASEGTTTDGFVVRSINRR